MEKLTIKLYDMTNGKLLAIFEDDELRIEKENMQLSTTITPKNNISLEQA